ncbi:MAG: YceI family protein [Elusimicrobia bacterium]|nr:YceI family protein [Elusimicrobiota bacterium]
MKTFLFLAVLSLGLAAAPSCRADSGSEAPLVLAPHSRLWLTGTSTLHPYASTATVLSVTLRVPGAALRDAVLSGKAGGLDLDVPVSGLRSGEKLLDKKMREALKAGAAPDIRFHMASYEAKAAAQGDGIEVEAAGTLSIAGRERPVTIDAEAKPVAGGLEISGSRSLLMSDFGVTPPKLFFGTLKVNDTVVVRFDITLMRSPGRDGRTQ